jgi:DNA-binding transcriptional regulator YhcF (GntR family)
LREAGHSIRAIAEELGVSPTTVQRVFTRMTDVQEAY